jgi:beta-N-acetylglucosaminidase
VYGANNPVVYTDPSGHTYCLPEDVNCKYKPATTSGYGFNEEIKKFPESYRVALENMHTKHPKWKFKALNPPDEWNVFIDAQDLGENNLIETSTPKSYQEKDPNNKDGWSPPVRGVIGYYADPRNFLMNEKELFQFLMLSYSETDTLEGVKGILTGTVHLKYADTIIKAAEKSKVSSYYLAVKLVAEAGPNGNPLTKGTVKDYEGSYNPYNWNASGKTDAEVLRSGAAFAKRKGWNSMEKALIGGADRFREKYIEVGQDTIYTQKFDIIPTGGLYSNQYMQNIRVSQLEGHKLYQSFVDNHALDASLVFKIPVYKGMPSRTSLPT